MSEPQVQDPQETEADNGQCQEVAKTSSKEPLIEHVDRLENDSKVRTENRENYKNRMKQMESELEVIQKTVAEVAGSSKGKKGNNQAVDKDDKEENKKLRNMIMHLQESLREKTSSHSRKTLQAEALESQVAALKEVTLLTKGMLEIRNAENDQLKVQIDLMQQKITAERVRQNAMIQKSEKANAINNELKEEYLKQVKLFADLKEKYEKKISILESEVERLKAMQRIAN